MSEFLVYKWDRDDQLMLVNHSKYWRSFDGHYGSGQNEAVLDSLKHSGYRYQAIPKHQQEQVYEKFMSLLPMGPVTVTFNVYGARIGHDFAVMTRAAFDRWISEIQEQVSAPGLQSPATSVYGKVDDKSSWFSWFKLGGGGTHPHP